MDYNKPYADTIHVMDTVFAIIYNNDCKEFLK